MYKAESKTEDFWGMNVQNLMLFAVMYIRTYRLYLLVK